MRKIFSMLFVFLCTISALADGLRIEHGPFLQNPSEHGMSVFFNTSTESFAWVEIKSEKQIGSQRFYSICDGHRMAYCTHFGIDITGLQAASQYFYRVVAVEITKFEPYHIEYGDTVMTSWESFSTINPKGSELTFFVFNDGHDDPKKVGREMDQCNLADADVVVYNGDMISYYDKPQQPFRGFIDLSVERFAKHTPFIYNRGNHEIRGNMSRWLGDMVGRPNGRYYNVYYYGNTALLVLDTGEDKPDTHDVYGGINDFDGYRHQQTIWLKDVLNTKAFRKAKHKIVLMHMPIVNHTKTPKTNLHGYMQLRAEWLPLLNKAGIDLLISGHTHQYQFYDKGTDGNNAPVVVADNHSATRVDVDDNGIHVKIIRDDGNVLMDKVF